ncbi:unnamed protein product [Durusdinium trenchii]|uniref:Uncharacterized protein n=1 Tax=Durusdinium trenchii TaxID=1381693 RepID=A0ABP0JTB9_9DINO
MGAERLCRCFVCDSLEVAPPGPEPQHFRRRWARPQLGTKERDGDVLGNEGVQEREDPRYS